ncbi:MAG: hypothetical protein MJZ61_03685 [Bacteroidales bacterium]|nr:hypothetical protein [Bacteroidales bacterium]
MKRLVSILTLMALPLLSMAQTTFTQRGRISILNNLPLQNIEVRSDKTGNVVRSTPDGQFAIETCDKDVLRIGNEIFMEQKFKVRAPKSGEPESLYVPLNFFRNRETLRKIVDGGYLDPQMEAEAIANLAVQKDYSHYPDITTCLQVEFPSVKVVNLGCLISPSNLGMDAMGGDACMLLIVGNREVSDLQGVDLSSVESMQLLRSNAAAMYGSKAKNDVFVIKFKGAVNYYDKD